MDIAAFKVSHSVVTDKDATTLRAARVRSKSIGAMDEMSRKVQNASTYLLRRESHEHAQQPVSSRASSRGRWMEVQGKCKMQAHITSGVVMDVAAFKVSHSVDKDAAALRAARARSKSIGAVDESS